jgi:hypothetical protein
MDTATDNRFRETSERLALLLVAQPREGWESEFEELIRREFERLSIPDRESERDGKSLEETHRYPPLRGCAR